MGLDKGGCGRVRVYLYELRDLGVVEHKRSLRGEALWRLRAEALSGLVPDFFLGLFLSAERRGNKELFTLLRGLSRKIISLFTAQGK
jgi:hypothetical protein